MALSTYEQFAAFAATRRNTVLVASVATTHCARVHLGMVNSSMLSQNP